MQISSENLALLKSSVQRIGFACVENSVDDRLLESLRQEAAVQRGSARRVADDGVVSYRGYLADLGPLARTFLTGRSIDGLLRSVFDRSFVLTSSSSCHTYYEAGDFLSPHRDGADDCEVTVLVYLDAASPNADASDSGLSLHVLEDRGDQPGEVLEAIKTRTGSIVVGRGSKVWHCRPRLLDGERVALLTACYSSAE
jgi:hypothetical protein